jgi:hypothetical protein
LQKSLHEGGLLIDEMTIQQDIQFSKKGGTLKLIGFKDFTEESKHMYILMNHKKNVCHSCGREDNKTTGPNIYISKRTTTP